MRFVRKIRGSKAHKYLLDGNNYVYAISRAFSHRIYWRCTESRTKLKCLARCATVGDAVFLTKQGEHNHESNFDPNAMDIVYDP